MPRPLDNPEYSLTVGWVKQEPREMVRYANRSRTAIHVPNGLTPCVTHHFRAGSLHAPYDTLI